MAKTTELAGDGPPRHMLAPYNGPYEHQTDLLRRHDATVLGGVTLGLNATVVNTLTAEPSDG